jgi:type I restriction enzyme, S subunit
MSSPAWTTEILGRLVPTDRPICYGVLKPGPFEDDGIRLVRIVDLLGDVISRSGLYRISTTLDQEFKRSRLRGGEILLSIQGTIGRVAIVPQDLGGANISRTIARIDVVDSMSSHFLRHWMCSSAGQRQLNDIVSGTTRDSLNIGALRNVRVPIPPRREQQEVAEILDTVDDVIRSTERLLAKLEQLKQGLLHDLLTRGINENGELRDPRRRPDLFHQTSSGIVPTTWRITELGAIIHDAVDGPFGSNLKSEHYVPDPGVRVVRLQNIGVGFFDDRDKAYVSAAHAASLTRHAVGAGDLLVASLGDDNHPFARSCVYPNNASDGIVKADCFRLRLVPSMALSKYVMHVLNCGSTRKALPGLAQGVTRDRVNLASLRRFALALPTIEEQALIVDVLERHEAALKRASGSLVKLRILKAGLMDDLLTGRVRVKTDDEDAA